MKKAEVAQFCEDVKNKATIANLLYIRNVPGEWPELCISLSKDHGLDLILKVQPMQQVNMLEDLTAAVCSSLRR